MGVISDMVDELAADLHTAGVQPCTDPATLLPMLTRHTVVAYIDAPRLTGMMVGGRVDVQLRVMLCGNPPAGVEQMRPVWDALPTLIRRYSITDPTGMDWLTAGDVNIPHYPITIHRRTTC